jgi:hypothetical protein
VMGSRYAWLPPDPNRTAPSAVDEAARQFTE